jgi:hypothetical protein
MGKDNSWIWKGILFNSTFIWKKLFSKNSKIKIKGSDFTDNSVILGYLKQLNGLEFRNKIDSETDLENIIKWNIE